MIDQPFRSFLSNRVNLLLLVYDRLRLTANMISIISVFIAVIAAYLCAMGYFWSSAIAWWFGRLLDGTDGIYARKTQTSSLFGAYLDIVCDMTAYSVMILGFAWHYPDLSWFWLTILSLYVLCIASALALGSLENEAQITNRDNRGLRLGAGLAEGGETGIAYSVFLLFPDQLSTWLSIWIGVLVITVISRTCLARKILQS